MPEFFHASDSADGSGLDLIIHRASVDRAFRRRLLVDPAAAIRDAFEIQLPSRFKIRFIERPADLDLLVVLPDLLDRPPLADARRRR